MIGLCLGAAQGLVQAFLPVTAFTLVWTHSVEQVEWQEDYRIAEDRLVLTEARVKGSGAGMDPPAGAVLRDGWWHYRPKIPPLEMLRLMRSTVVEDYRFCADGRCRPLAVILPIEEGVVSGVWACDRSSDVVE